MDIVTAVIDSAELLVDSAGSADKAISFLNIHGAENLLSWATDRERHGPNAENAKALVNAGVAFLGAASLSGLDLDSAFREVCLQAEEATGAHYLDGYERQAAKNARHNERQPDLADVLSELFSGLPAGKVA